MPEWGQLPIPTRLLEQGVTDMVRISGARMSGTAFGTVVLHVATESAAGGPLLAVRNDGARRARPRTPEIHGGKVGRRGRNVLLSAGQRLIVRAGR
jgi:hypothetical protein